MGRLSERLSLAWLTDAQKKEARKSILDLLDRVEANDLTDLHDLSQEKQEIIFNNFKTLVQKYGSQSSQVSRYYLGITLIYPSLSKQLKEYKK